MKIAQAVSASLLATAALSGATQAYATISDPAASPTDLIVAVWNPSTNSALVQDVGVSPTQLLDAGTFQSSAGYTNSWQLDTSGSQLSTDLGAGTYQYLLFAVDYSNPANGTYTGNQEFLSLAGNGSSPPPGLTNSSLIDSFETSTATWLTGNSGAWTSFVGETIDVRKSSAPGYCAGATFSGGAAPCVNSAGTNFFNLNGWNGGVAAGQTLALVNAVGGSPDSAAANAVESYVGNGAHAGLFSFNQATGLLSYNLTGVSSVPLPAAGWLLVSGLLGLGAVGRRRQARLESAAA